MILEFPLNVYIFEYKYTLEISYLEALDASQVVQLLCRLHRDAAGEGRVLPLHGQGGVGCG